MGNLAEDFKKAIPLQYTLGQKFNIQELPGMGANRVLLSNIISINAEIVKMNGNIVELLTNFPLVLGEKGDL